MIGGERCVERCSDLKSCIFLSSQGKPEEKDTLLHSTLPAPLAHPSCPCSHIPQHFPRGAQLGSLHSLHQPEGRTLLNWAPSFLTRSLLFGPGLPIASCEKMPFQAPPAGVMPLGPTGPLATHYSSSPLYLNAAMCARKAVPTDSLIRTNDDSLN